MAITSLPRSRAYQKPLCTRPTLQPGWYVLDHPVDEAGISFWRYLLDRCSGSNTVPYLPDLIRQRAQEVHA